MSQLLKNTSWYAAGRILPKITSFVLLPIYTRYMSPEEYGISAAMVVLGSIFAILFTLGIDRCIARLYWDYETESERATFLGTAFLMLCLSAAAACAACFVLQPILANLFPSIPFYPYYLYPILSAAFGVIELVPMATLQIRQQGAKFMRISLIQFFLSTAFIVYLVVFRQWGAEGMLCGQLLGKLCLIPLFLYMTTRMVRFGFRWASAKPILAFSVPLVPNLFSGWAMTSVDRFVIERFCSLSDLGIFSLSNRIGSLVLVFASAFTFAYSPIVHQTATGSTRRDTRDQLKMQNRFYIVLCCVVSFGIAFLARELIIGLLDTRYHSAVSLVPLLAASHWILVLTSITNLSYHQEKKTGTLAMIMLVGLVLNLTLNWVCVPIWGIYGAAITTIITNLVILLLKCFVGTHFNLIIYPWKHLLLFSALASMAVVGFQRLDLAVVPAILCKMAICLVCLILWLAVSPQWRHAVLGRRVIMS